MVATLGPVNWVVGKHNKLLDTQTCHNRQTWRVCCSWFLHVKSKLRIKFAYLVFIIFGLNWPCCLLWLMLLTACSAIIVLFSSRGWNWTMQKSGLDINEFFLWGNVLKQDQKIKYTIYRTTEKSFIYCTKQITSL